MLRCLALLGLTILLSGCIHVKMDPIEVQATVNVNVRVDQALTNFFGDLDQKSQSVVTP